MPGIMDTTIKEKLNVWRKAVRHYLIHPQIDPEPAYLMEPLQYALNTEGKMLRPALCLAATEAVGGDWQDAVVVAAALEIFHTFTLVHDDIMDGDELRRGQATVHAAYDSNRALLSGDTMLIHVYQLLAGSNSEKLPQLLKAFNTGAMDVCRGQGWDMQFENSTQVEPRQYEMMIDL
jgi:geranylgeranyl diphosphate synthase type II